MIPCVGMGGGMMMGWMWLFWLALFALVIGLAGAIAVSFARRSESSGNVRWL